MVFAMFPHQMVPKSFLLKLEHLKKVTQSSNFFLQDLTTLESLAEHGYFEKSVSENKNVGIFNTGSTNTLNLF